MAKTRSSMMKAVRQKQAAYVSSANAFVRDAERILKGAHCAAALAEERQSSTAEMLKRMALVRESSDLEIRMMNLPRWYSTNHPNTYIRGKNGFNGYIDEALSAKLDAIFDRIAKEHDQVYRAEGDGMVHWQEFLRQGHKESDFSYDWYKPLSVWAGQYRERAMEEKTYRMIIEGDVESIFGMIKSGKISF